MRVAVIGLGHIGLVTALGLAEFGNEIVGYDLNPKLRDELKHGVVSYAEAGIREALTKHLNTSFFVADSMEIAAENCSCFLFCVGTPSDKSGKADLSILESAVKEVLSCLPKQGTCTLVVRSTVYPGGIREKIMPIAEEYRRGGMTVQVAANPEFLRESYAWNDFCSASRLLIGADDAQSASVVRELYAKLPATAYCVSLETAEFTKFLSNCMLATMISFSNEMSFAARAIGNITIEDAFSFVKKDERWSGGKMAEYIYPGCGYGGYCLPKDTKAMLGRMEQCNTLMPVLEAVVHTNNSMPAKIVSVVSGSVPRNAKIGILGLAFKPHSDDVRESPAEKIIGQLLNEGYLEILVYDHLANHAFHSAFPHLAVQFCDSLPEMIQKADVFINLHNDEEFRRLGRLTTKPIFDFRYCGAEKREDAR